MNVAAKMTPDQFLASNPADHPDFVECDRPTDHPKLQSVRMPNLVALIRRMGGVDTIPDQGAPGRGIDRPYFDIWHSMPDRLRYHAILRDSKSHRVYAEVHRMGADNLIVQEWHPHDTGLAIIFGLPADWTAAPWSVELVQIADIFSSTTELDALVIASCDRFIGAIQKATDTYCLIRRDLFIP
jgi:hypothetical protein